MPTEGEDPKKLDLGHLRLQAAGRIQIPKDELEDANLVGGDSARVILDDIVRIGRHENPGKKRVRKEKKPGRVKTNE